MMIAVTTSAIEKVSLSCRAYLWHLRYLLTYTILGTTQARASQQPYDTLPCLLYLTLLALHACRCLPASACAAATTSQQRKKEESRKNEGTEGSRKVGDESSLGIQLLRNNEWWELRVAYIQIHTIRITSPCYRTPLPCWIQNNNIGQRGWIA